MNLSDLPLGAARGAAPIPAAAGIGLRLQHHDRMLAERPRVAWLEVHAENYLGAGVAADDLLDLRRDYPVSLHVTGLSLGSADIDAAHVEAIAALCRRLEPGLVSDHLSWSAADGVHLPDLLPLPLTEQALAVFARNLDRVQTALGRPILIENPSSYLSFADNQMGEAEFLDALVGRTGCGVLLDVNNIAVSAGNLGESPGARLAALLDRLGDAVGEIHLAGHATRRLDDGAVVRIDDHGSPVSEEVWSLFETAVERLGARPTLIEWDTDVPALEALRAEARKAQRRLDGPPGSASRAVG